MIDGIEKKEGCNHPSSASARERRHALRQQPQNSFSLISLAAAYSVPALKVAYSQAIAIA